MSDRAHPRRRLRHLMVAALGCLLILGLVATIVSQDVRFLLRAAYEEGRILLKRRSLQQLIADARTPPTQRALFQLVLAARTFGADSLGLTAGDTYTAFTDVGRDTLVLVLSASPRFALEPYVWRYPIVGVVPYKGFFDRRAALAEAERLSRDGYDTYLRPSGAFSTLGWFNDPLLSTALFADSVQLAATVLHEIAHNTLYVPSATPFNESFAAFVGYRGAEAFFRSQGNAARATHAAAMWQDEVVLGEFYRDLARQLDGVYAGDLTGEELEGARTRVFDEARWRLTGPIGARFQSYRPEYIARRPLNNASVIAARLYRTELALFDQLYEQFGRDLRRAVSAIVTSVRARADADPFQVLADAGRLSFSLQ